MVVKPTIPLFIRRLPTNKKIKIKFEGEDIVQEIVKAVLLIELAGTYYDRMYGYGKASFK